MQRPVLIACTLSLLLPAGPALSVVCENIGAATTVGGATDNGDGTSLACGDDAQAIGDSAVALGLQSRGNGNGSVAIGVEATAEGFGIAIGLFSDATDAGAIALGSQTDVGGNNAIGIGSGVQATGLGSVTVGNLAFNDGESSIAIGDGAEVIDITPGETPFGAVAIGREAFTLGNSAVALGSSAGSTDFGTALGAFARASGIRSTAIGYRAQAIGNARVVIGEIPGVNGGLFFNDVGLGIAEPIAPLHVFRDDDTREFLLLESDETGVTQDRAMMDLSNNGGIRFQFANNTLGTAWRFQAATGNQDRFEVTKVGTGQIEFAIDEQGNGFIAGDLDVGGDLLTNVLLPSDVNAKQGIEAIDAEDVLERVASLPVSTWEYTKRPGERHIGPMAQDFREAFGLGSNDTSISVVDASGVALASIQALNEKLNAQNAALRARNQELDAKNARLEERLERVETMMAQLLPRTARN